MIDNFPNLYTINLYVLLGSVNFNSFFCCSVSNTWFNVKSILTDYNEIMYKLRKPIYILCQ